MNWSEKLMLNICPGDVFRGMKQAPAFDIHSEIFGENDYIIGCRGISCQQCWEQEAEDDAEHETVNTNKEA